MDTVPQPSTLLDDQICFALYAASRAVTARYRPMLDDLGITYPQWLALMALWETDGMSVNGLGARLGLDSGTMSPLVKRLETLGLVTRHRSTDDERLVLVRLTDAGRALQDPSCSLSQMMIDELGMTVAEFAELKSVLENIAQRMGRPMSTSRV
ncbi:MarR family winged helix-turn-helix transcriptional regulator [Blastococcus sp. LR1]|uniref:MarR family winged helix-turn-helix transcriptional regulator n=1 Tax=Blastococcus sp. LR1 TaxID=2877000 RepID=UPI001CCDBD6C|nr:MarR family transcriptional regulator [Blastococcus sp. LR1]MCA0143994.1 MarR family transcriptional regulator [Blastococcus sp. LR1]